MPSRADRYADRLLARGLPRDVAEERRALAWVEQRLIGRNDGPLQLGRYSLLRRLGAGGWGTVYAAYDPKLDRQVAIKLIHRGEGDDASTADQIAREATALARLSHPNVIAVHDVGSYNAQERDALGLPESHDGGLFIVMELVNGIPFSEWLRVKERSWAGTLDVLVDVGRGLAAAHAESLVHRDVKPANVLIGTDGRVRIADFGLARASPREAVTLGGDEDGRESLVAGTPAYMAPEQHRGEHVDGRADQYGWCVMAWEALFGVRPFTGASEAALQRAKSEGTLRPPAEARAPGWLSAVLIRGLSPDRNDRFPSMGALLSRISRARHGRRRRMVAVGLVAAAGTLAAAVAVAGEDSACAGQEALLTGVWDTESRMTVADALTESDVPYADATWRALEALIDSYADKWLQTRTDVCRATFVDKEQSANLLEYRQTCLDLRLERLRVFVGELRVDPAGVADRAVMVAETLPDPSPCASAEPPGGTGSLAVREELSRRLISASSLAESAKYKSAITSASKIEVDAQAEGWPEVAAKALLIAADSAGQLDNADEAEALLRRALVLATEAGDDETTIRVLIEQVQVVGRRLRRYDEAELLIDLAKAHLRRRNIDDGLDARLAYEVGAVRHQQRRFDDCLEEHRAALATRRRLLAAGDTRIGATLNGIGLCMLERGDVDEAGKAFAEALDVMQSKLGADHPEATIPLTNLALVEARGGEFELAAAKLERAAAIQRRALETDNLLVGNTLLALGNQYQALGRFEEAAARHAEAAEIGRRLDPPDQMLVATAVGNLGNALSSLGRLEDAKNALDEQERIYEGFLPKTDSRRSLPLLNRGAVLLLLGRAEEALRDAKRAEALVEGDADALPWLGLALAVKGQAHLKLGDHARATPALERALTLLGGDQRNASSVADVQFSLAQALLASERGRALGLAKESRELFGELGMNSERNRVVEWLQANGG